MSVSIQHYMKSNWIESNKIFSLKLPGKGYQPNLVFKSPTTSSEFQTKTKHDEEIGFEI